MNAGRELDSLIACKVMDLDGVCLLAGRTIYLEKDDITLEVPHYSTSIAAAWSVVEKLRSIRPVSFTMRISSSPGGNYKVEVFSQFRVEEPVVEWRERFEFAEIEQTAAHAICSAAFRLVSK